VAYLAAQRPRSWPLNRRSLSVGFAPRIGLGAGRACPGKRPPARKARRAAVARIGDAGAWPRLRSRAWCEGSAAEIVRFTGVPDYWVIAPPACRHLQQAANHLLESDRVRSQLSDAIATAERIANRPGGRTWSGTGAGRRPERPAGTTHAESRLRRGHQPRSLARPGWPPTKLGLSGR
jgi:hypothetical protein